MPKLKDDILVYRADTLARALELVREYADVDPTVERLYSELVNYLYGELLPDFYVVDVRDPALFTNVG